MLLKKPCNQKKINHIQAFKNAQKLFQINKIRFKSRSIINNFIKPKNCNYQLKRAKTSQILCFARFLIECWPFLVSSIKTTVVHLKGASKRLCSLK